MNSDWSSNHIEYLISLHESKSFHYNSGIEVEFDIPFERKKLEDSLLLLLQKYPVLLYPLNIKDSSKIISKLFRGENIIVDTFVETRDISKGEGLLLSLSTDGKKVKFYIHHSLVDGITHSYLFKELLAFYYNQNDLPTWNRNGSIHSKSKMKLFLELFNPEFRSMIKSLNQKYDCFTLVEGMSSLNQSYKVSDIKIPYDVLREIKVDSKSLKISVFNYIVWKACLALMKSKDEDKRDIVIACPINLRSLIRNSFYFGNMICLHRFSVKQENLKNNTAHLDIKQNLRKMISKKFFQYSFDSLLFISKFLPKSYLRKIFSAKTVNSSDINSSIMVSHMKMDPDTFPKGCDVKQVSMRSAIFKSPGVGLIVIEGENELFLSITFCHDEIPESKQHLFLTNLKNELSL